MRQALMFVMLSAACAPYVSAEDNKDVKNLLEVKGSPAFTATSIDTRGNLLICDGLELFDDRSEMAAQKLRGRVLLFCESWDGLWLWAANTDLKMRRATPFLGLERPGGKFADAMPAKRIEVTKLIMPAKVSAAVVDERGMVLRTSEISVHQLRCKD